MVLAGRSIAIRHLNTRRGFLAKAAAASGGLALAGCGLNFGTSERPPASSVDGANRNGQADVTLRIGNVLVDVAKDHTISTTGYNGSAPGPLIKLSEGVPVTVELTNDTGASEFVHWHGQSLPADIDGADEENSLVVPPHGSIRYRLLPQPAGSRFVHSHSMAMSDLNRGTYSGQFAFVYIEPKSNPGAYNQEFFLATHEYEPFFTSAEEEDEEEGSIKLPAHAVDTKANGWEIGYQRFTINGKCLGFGEPLRVKEGQRVLFHFLNGSATENIKLALAGHHFQVVALDGNPVPRPQLVDVLELGTAERIDAVVEMKNPGIWILGTPKDDDRANGMGIVLEYAGKTGAPKWIAPPKKPWDYTLFGNEAVFGQPDETISLVFGKLNGGTGSFNLWTINGKSYEDRDPPTLLHKGRRYRLVFDNQTDDAHPVHLHRNSFELVDVAGKKTSGIMKTSYW